MKRLMFTVMAVGLLMACGGGSTGNVPVVLSRAIASYRCCILSPLFRQRFKSLSKRLVVSTLYIATV